MPSALQTFAASASLVTVLILQGCGGGGDPSPTPAPPGTTPAAPTPSGPTPTPTTVTTTAGISKNTHCKTAGPAPPAPAPGQPIGWNPTTTRVGSGNWCEVGVPDPSWKLNNFCSSPSGGTTVNGDGITVNTERFLSTAGVQIKILTYNLYWWNLFRQRKGADGMAGKNIAAFAKDVPFDLMGFQECEDISWPLRDAAAAGMANDFTTFNHEAPPIAQCLAYRNTVFSELGRGSADVAEDGKAQHYGRRMVLWVRLQHKASGKTVFFINHHGPTPVNSGGICGAEGTAFNILKVIGTNAKVGDHVVLTGDFNAWSNGPDGTWLSEIGNIDCHLPHVFSNPVISDVWGIDNIFASCAKTISTTVMPKGGSDHNALNVVIEI